MHRKEDTMADKNTNKSGTCTFEKRYMDMAADIEERFGEKAALGFDKALAAYLLDGTEPDFSSQADLEESVWEKAKREIAKCQARRKNADRDRALNGRRLEDLSDEEFAEVLALYHDGTNFVIIRQKYWLRNYSIDPDKIDKECRRRGLPVDLKTFADCSLEELESIRQDLKAGEKSYGEIRAEHNLSWRCKLGRKTASELWELEKGKKAELERQAGEALKAELEGDADALREVASYIRCSEEELLENAHRLPCSLEDLRWFCWYHQNQFNVDAFQEDFADSHADVFELLKAVMTASQNWEARGVSDAEPYQPEPPKEAPQFVARERKVNHRLDHLW